MSLLVGVVYKITNCLNGMSYVGQTTRPIEERFKGHVHGTLFVDKIIQEVGAEHFTCEILEECKTIKQLREREVFWIVESNSLYPNGYNLNDGIDNITTFTPFLKGYSTPQDPISIVKGTIGRKWKLKIIFFLHENGATRFNELRRRIPGLTNIMLTKSLREMEMDGIIERHELISAPPKIVEYSLAPLGKELIPILNELYAWGQKILRR